MTSIDGDSRSFQNDCLMFMEQGCLFRRLIKNAAFVPQNSLLADLHADFNILRKRAVGSDQILNNIFLDHALRHRRINRGQIFSLRERKFALHDNRIHFLGDGSAIIGDARVYRLSG